VLQTLLTLAPAQGALLLVLFHTSHAVEHALTARARGGLGALAARIPAVATAVDAPAPGAEPDLASAREVPVGDVAVGQLTLVRPGEQARGAPLHARLQDISLFTFSCAIQKGRGSQRAQ